MKREVLILCAIALITLFSSCKKEPLEPPVEISPQNPLIMDLNTSQDFSANLPVFWTFSHPNAGEIETNGTFTSMDSIGHYYLIATSQADETNRDTVSVRVSNRADILNEIISGGYVIYLRHAIATVGADSLNFPLGWQRSCNSDTARQLSPEGITQAKDLGAAFRGLKIPLAEKIFTSEFCRCLQTPELMDLGKQTYTEKDLTFHVYGEDERHQKTLNFIDSLNPVNENYLVVSHSFGPGSTLPQIEQGYAAIFKPQSGPTFVAIVRDDELIILK